MVMTDPIADYLTRIRNANMAKHSSVEIPASSMKKSLSEILKNEGFIRDYQVEDDNKQGMIKIFLKYGPNNERVISGLKRFLKRSQLPKMVTTSLLRDQKVNLLDTLIHALPLNKKMEKFILVVQVKLTKLFMVLKEQILLP